MKKNDPIFRRTSRRFQSDTMSSESVFAAVKVAQHIKLVHLIWLELKRGRHYN